MNEYDFEGRVAVVTGAGRGIGRAHALLLAERGASVVVNDLGGSMEGVGADAEPASTVAAEIVAAGGAAVADTSDVASEAGAQALVDTAVERFGRLDILVNNAGIMRMGGLSESRRGQPREPPRRPSRRIVQHRPRRVAPHGRTGLRPHRHDHLLGSVRAAQQPLVRHRQGGRHRAHAQSQDRRRRARHQDQPHRARGVHAHGGRGPDDSPEATQMSPDLVAPMVAFLAHEDCPVSGEIYAAGAGRFARIFIASTEGYVHPTPEPTVEDVAEHWAEINDETGYSIPVDLMGWSAAFMAHLG